MRPDLDCDHSASFARFRSRVSLVARVTRRISGGRDAKAAGEPSIMLSP
jgi:hypothetical protein